jgi:hypothetical protein
VGHRCMGDNGATQQVVGHFKSWTSPDGNVNDLVPLNKVELYLIRKRGDEYEKDCSCDLAFLMDNMDGFGKAIRAKYWWVPREVPIELIMDNAGGHGTKDCIADYIEMLKRDHNVVVWHQIPWSPDTNILDLGIWCGVQHHFEKMQCGKTRSNVGALARTIELAWDMYDSNRAFANIFKRWKKVLRLINAQIRDNILSDSARRKEFIVPIVLNAPVTTSGGSADNDNDNDDDDDDDDDADE